VHLHEPARSSGRRLLSETPEAGFEVVECLVEWFTDEPFCRPHAAPAPEREMDREPDVTPGAFLQVVGYCREEV